jgi:hypothetical protein
LCRREWKVLLGEKRKGRKEKKWEDLKEGGKRRG